MLDSKIKNKLENIQYEIISQERPILSVSNAEGIILLRNPLQLLFSRLRMDLLGVSRRFKMDALIWSNSKSYLVSRS